MPVTCWLFAAAVSQRRAGGADRSRSVWRRCFRRAAKRRRWSAARGELHSSRPADGHAPGPRGVIGTRCSMPPDGDTLDQTISFVTDQFLLPRAPMICCAISFHRLVVLRLRRHDRRCGALVEELIALAKAKPASCSISAAGVGTDPHIAGELFNLLANVDIVAVQFKGGDRRHGRHRGRGPGHVRQRLAADRPRESRPLACARRDERAAQSRDARAADGRRGGRAGLRVRHLVRRRRRPGARRARSSIRSIPTFARCSPRRSR